jgi:hypothetical protein
MSRLSDLSKDKNTIMLRMINSQNLCKAIYYTDTNFLDKPDIDDPSTLIYKNIFPYRQIPPDDETETHTYVTMYFGGYKPTVGGFYKAGKVWIHAIVNLDAMRTDYGVLRTDYIISEIDKIINDERGLGIGKAKFYSLDDIYVNKSYTGIQICYEITEFN